VNLKNGWPRTYSEVPSGPAACQPYNPTNSRLERGYTATIGVRAQRVHAIDPQWRQDVICGAALDEMRWGAVGG
jgi:hypothetical protein